MSGHLAGSFARSFSRRLRLCAGTALICLFGLGASGCGDEISQLVSCSTASDCPKPLGMVEVECCGGSCVGAAAGCDSGYRFITSEPEVGECAAKVMCAARADMSVAQDLSKVD